MIGTVISIAGHTVKSGIKFCDSNMLIITTKHKHHFAIKLHYSLCMYMHRNTLVYIYIYFFLMSF